MPSDAERVRGGLYPPLSTSQLLSRDNVIRRQAPPKQLSRLKSRNLVSISDATADLHPQDLVTRVELAGGARGWCVGGDRKVMRGLSVREFVAQRVPPGSQVESPTLPLPPPEPPEWSDLIYHPKILPRQPRARSRRKTGKALHPHGYIWGSDVRQPFFPSGYPWQCIGRLDVWNNPYSFVPSSSGTGALVGSNVVLTASHMVPWGADPVMIQFTPAYFNGVSTVGTNVASFVNAASAYDTASSPAPAFDFAVLRLEDRLGDSLGTFGVKSYSDSWNDQNYWTLVGYPGLVMGGQQPSFQGGINFHDDDEDSNDFGNAMELETQNGESTGGDSGGPYFAFWDEGPYIVGVDVGGEAEFVFNPFAPWPFEDDNNVASAGPALVQLVRWARDNWS
jgi:Trypsin-like peptidase domain